MKIGIFDSGLGGLIIAKAIFKRLPKYDYVYFGDTKNLPYGEKSPEEIYSLTEKAIDFLFKQNCQLVIIACNSASAWALRKIQQNYLPINYPNRRVLGVIIPTLEVADNKHKHKKIGVIATSATINSHIYKKELAKINPKAKIFEVSAPDLVPLIEQNSLQEAQKTLQLYLNRLKKVEVDCLILGCTHYPLLKQACKNFLGKKVIIISQDEIIPKKLAEYLKRHSDLLHITSKQGKREFFVSTENKDFNNTANRLFGKKVNFKLAIA